MSPLPSEYSQSAKMEEYHFESSDLEDNSTDKQEYRLESDQEEDERVEIEQPQQFVEDGNSSVGSSGSSSSNSNTPSSPSINFQQAPRPRNLPMQSSRNNLKSHPDLPNVIEEDEHDDAETVYSEFEYSVRDGIRFLKSANIEDKNEALDRLVKSVYDCARRDRVQRSSTGSENYSSTADSAAAAASASDAFHHGLDKDELMSMVAVLTKQSTFSDILYKKTSTSTSSRQLNRQPSSQSMAGKSRAGESKAGSSMPSLTECSSLASSVSRAFSRSVNSRTPVINKNQLFAMRKEQRVHADSMPQQPSRQHTEFSDCESMMSEDDLESNYSRNSSSLRTDPFAAQKRAGSDQVPQQPSRRFTEYSDVESSGEEDASVRSRGSQRSRRRGRADRVPRFPTRSCASLASCDDDNKSICTMTRVEEEEELPEDVPYSIDNSASTIETSHLTGRGRVPDLLPRLPSPSGTPHETPNSSHRMLQTVQLGTVPSQPEVVPPNNGGDSGTNLTAEDNSEEYWEFPDPTPIKKKKRLRLKKNLKKFWKLLCGSSATSEQQAKIVENFLPKHVEETKLQVEPTPRVSRNGQAIHSSSALLTVTMDETSVQGSMKSGMSYGVSV